MPEKSIHPESNDVTVHLGNPCLLESRPSTHVCIRDVNNETHFRERKRTSAFFVIFVKLTHIIYSLGQVIIKLKLFI